MMFDYEKTTDRRGTDCSKWDNMSSMFSEKGLLPLWIADMDFRCSEAVIDAIIKRAQHGVFGYTVVGDRYYDAVCSWMKRRHDWTIQKDWFVTSVTVVSALNILVQCVAHEGDGVIIQRPVYFPFEECIRENGRVVVDNPLVDTNGYYTIDFEDLEQKAANPKNSMMFLCSPHNPVCRAWNKEELQQIVDICVRHDVVLVSDEIHADFVFKGVHIPLASLTDYPKIVTCTSPSKTFNLAGLKMANIIIPDEAIRYAFNRRSKIQCGIVPNNPLSIEGITAAYSKGDVWLDDVRRLIWSNYEYLGSYLLDRLPRLRMTEPEATYLAWVDFSGVGLRGETLRKFLREKARVALDEGIVFGPSSASYARINVATDRTILRECLERLEMALGEP